GLIMLTGPSCCPVRALRRVAERTLEISRNKNRPPGSSESSSKVCMLSSPPNILVVEDDRETRTLIAKYLRTNGCNVTAATDGREMARTMADHRIDLVILDVMLPGEDGLSLCRKVRTESQVPIIMLTARGEDVD